MRRCQSRLHQLTPGSRLKLSHRQRVDVWASALRISITKVRNGSRSRRLVPCWATPLTVRRGIGSRLGQKGLGRQAGPGPLRCCSPSQQMFQSDWTPEHCWRQTVPQRQRSRGSRLWYSGVVTALAAHSARATIDVWESGGLVRRYQSRLLHLIPGKRLKLSHSQRVDVWASALRCSLRISITHRLSSPH